MFCLQLQPQNTSFHRHPASLSTHNFKLNGGGEGGVKKSLKNNIKKIRQKNKNLTLKKEDKQLYLWK